MNNFDSDTDILAMMGPGAPDKALRDAVQLCWMSLPPNKRTLEELKVQVDRIVNRIFGDLTEDCVAFLDIKEVKASDDVPPKKK